MKKFDTLWLEERLKKISTLLIEAHKCGNQDAISHYAQRLPQAPVGSTKRQFMHLIQVFHPDRLAVFVQQVAELQAVGNISGLNDIEVLLEYEIVSGTHTKRQQSSSQNTTQQETEDFGFSETYEYDEDDFGFDDELSQDNDDFFRNDDFEEEDLFARGSFMDAIKSEFFGNLDLYPTKNEIEHLEGELDLSDYNLNNLTGAEYCINISSLNLAMNQIDNIWPLRDLSRLEYLDLSSNLLENVDDLGTLIGLTELDLSFNEIEDVSFLLKLPILKCVSLVGNPIQEQSVIDLLRKQDVLVIF